MGPPCNKLLPPPPPPPQPCSRKPNFQSLAVFSRFRWKVLPPPPPPARARLMMARRKEEGRAGERGGRSGRGHRFIFGNNSHHLFSRVTRVPIRPTDRRAAALLFCREASPRDRRRSVKGASLPVVALLPFPSYLPPTASIATLVARFSLSNP